MKAASCNTMGAIFLWLPWREQGLSPVGSACPPPRFFLPVVLLPCLYLLYRSCKPACHRDGLVLLCVPDGVGATAASHLCGVSHAQPLLQCFLLCLPHQPAIALAHSNPSVNTTCTQMRLHPQCPNPENTQLLQKCARGHGSLFPDGRNTQPAAVCKSHPARHRSYTDAPWFTAHTLRLPSRH